jgi:hypothetical protein
MGGFLGTAAIAGSGEKELWLFFGSALLYFFLQFFAALALLGTYFGSVLVVSVDEQVLEFPLRRKGRGVVIG